MNPALRDGDSGCITKIKTDKTFVIQNLFRKLRKLNLSPEIFLNYSLDSNLSPKRRAAPVEDGDKHLQLFENKREFLSRVAVA